MRTTGLSRVLDPDVGPHELMGEVSSLWGDLIRIADRSNRVISTESLVVTSRRLPSGKIGVRVEVDMRPKAE